MTFKILDYSDKSKKLYDMDFVNENNFIELSKN